MGTKSEKSVAKGMDAIARSLRDLHSEPSQGKAKTGGQKSVDQLSYEKQLAEESVMSKVFGFAFLGETGATNYKQLAGRSMTDKKKSFAHVLGNIFQSLNGGNGESGFLNKLAEKPDNGEAIVNSAKLFAEAGKEDKNGKKVKRIIEGLEKFFHENNKDFKLKKILDKLEDKEKLEEQVKKNEEVPVIDIVVKGLSEESIEQLAQLLNIKSPNNLLAISNFLQAMSLLSDPDFTINKENIEKNLRILRDIVDPKNKGPFAELLQTLEEASRIMTTQGAKKLEVICGFVQLVALLGTFDERYYEASKAGTLLLNQYILDSNSGLISLLRSLDEATNAIAGTGLYKLQFIFNFVDAVSLIGTFNPDYMKYAAQCTVLLCDFAKTSLVELGNALGEASQNIVIPSIKPLQLIFDFVNAVALIGTFNPQFMEAARQAAGMLVQFASTNLVEIGNALGQAAQKIVIPNIKSLQLVFDFVNAVALIGTFDEQYMKIAKEHVKLLVDFVNSSDGLKLIISSLQNLAATIEKDSLKNLQEVFEFVKVVALLGTLDENAIDTSKANIKLLDAFLQEEGDGTFRSLITSLNNLDVTINTDGFKDLKSIIEFITVVASTGKFDEEQLKTSKESIKNLNTFLQDNTEGILSIIDNVNKIDKEVNTTATKSVDEIQKFIASFSKLGNADSKAIHSAKTNILSIKELFESKRGKDSTLTELINTINRIEPLTNTASGNFSKIQEFINTIKNFSQLNKVNMTSLKHSIGEILSLFDSTNGNESDSITTLLTKINDVSTKVDDTKSNYSKIRDFISTITAITDINSASLTRAKTNIQQLLALFDDKGKNGESNIKSLINAANSVGTIANDSKTKGNIDALKNFIDAIQGIMKISFTDLLTVPLKVKFIKNFIANDIKDIINVLNDATKEANDKGSNSIKTLKEFIDAITKIADMTEKQRQNIFPNIEYIKSILQDKNGILSIIETVASVAERSGEGMKQVQSITDFIGKIVSLGDVDEDKLQNIISFCETASDIVKDIVGDPKGKSENSLYGIIDAASKKYNADEMQNNIKNITTIFKALQDIPVPGFKTAFMQSLALGYVSSNVQEIADILTTISKFVKLEDKTFEAVESAKSILEKINALKDPISEANGLKDITGELLDNITNFNKKLSKIQNSLVIPDKEKNEEFISNTKIFAAGIDSITKKFKALKMEPAMDKAENVLEFIKKVITASMLIGKTEKNELATEQQVQDLGIFFENVNNEIIKKLEGLNNLDADIETATKVTDFLKKAVESSKILGKAKMMADADKVYQLADFFAAIKENKDGHKSLIDTIQGLNSIDKDVETAEKVMSFLKSATKASIFLGIIPKAMLASSEKVEKLASFYEAITAELLPKIQAVKIEDGMFDTAKDITKLIIYTAVAAIISTIALPFVVPAKFAVKTMAGLINTIVELCQNLNNNQSDISKGIGVAKDIVLLVVGCGVVMIIGGLIMSMYPKLIAGSFAFAATMGAFMFAVLGAINIGTRGMDTTRTNLKELGILILACGVTLILGGLIMTMYPKLIIGSMMFAATLGAFCFAVIGAINLASRGMNTTKTNLKELGMLIMACGVTMLIGGLVMTMYPKLIAGSMMFAVTLGLFCFAVIGAINLGTRGMNTAKTNLKQLSILILACGVTMLLGGLVMTMYPQLIVGSFLFTVSLGLFCAAVIKAINWGTKGMKQTKSKLMGLIIVVGLSALIMTIGGTLFIKYPKLAVGALIFTTVLAAFCWSIGATCKFLGKHDKDIRKGSGIMAILVGIMTLSSIAFNIIVDAANKADMMKTFLAATIMVGIIFVLANLAFGLAAAMQYSGVGLPIVLAAAAVLGVIVAMVYVAALAVEKIAFAMKTLSECKPIDLGTVINNITAFMSLIPALGMLGNPVTAFTIIAASRTMEGVVQMMSKIAAAVEEYANLKVAIYQGTKVVGYRQLKQKDFNSAAKNVSKIITTVGKAIIDTYNKNPEMFSAGLLGDFFGMDTPFTRVVKSCQKLGPMISSIAHAVKTYADMKIPIYQGDKVTGYKHLTDKDYQGAAKNISLIITTIGGALIDTYNKKPEMFTAGTLGDFFGMDNPMTRVIKTVKKLGPLISSIAAGVRSYAKLQIPDKWDKDGHPIHYVDLDRNQVYKEAPANIEGVINVIGGALMKTYEKHKDWYEDTSIFSIFGAKPENTPFARVISVNTKLGNLIGSIAKGIQSYAKLMIPDKWNKDGYPIHYEKLDQNQVYKDAPDNIKGVINVIGGALMDTYKEHKDWYEDDSIFSCFGQKAENTPFARVISVNTKLGNLIGSIAKGIQSYAKLMIPDKWDKSGTPIHYKELNKKEIYKDAPDNIVGIISTIGGALMQSYVEHKDWYEDSSIFSSVFGQDPGNTPFSMVLSANTKLGKLITDISKGVQSFARMSIPKYNSKGEIVGYDFLKDSDKKAAATNIAEIIEVLANGLMKTYDTHPEWYKDDSIWGSLFGSDPGNTPFSMVISLNGKLGELVSNISDGVKSFATLQIPTEWNKNGKPIKYEKLKPSAFTDAANNICTIVSTIGTGLMTFYTEHKEWFTDDENSPWNQIMGTTTNLGQMISDISSAITTYATGGVPIFNDKGEQIGQKPIDEALCTSASNSIMIIVETVGNGIMGVYDEHPEWFNQKWDKDGKPIGDTLFGRVSEACTNLGTMIGDIAEGIATFASSTFIDSNGKEHSIGKAEAQKAADSIKLVVSTLGGAICSTFKDHKDWFENPPIKSSSWFGFCSETKPDNSPTTFARACTALGQMGAMIGMIAEGIAAFASSTYVTADGRTLHIGKYEAQKAADSVALVVSNLGKSIINTANDPRGPFTPYNINKTKSVIEYGCKMGTMISSISEGVKNMANLTVAEYKFDSKTGTVKQIGVRKLAAEDFDLAKTHIGQILSTMGNALVEMANKNSYWNSDECVNQAITMAMKIGDVISSIAEGVKDMAELTVKSYTVDSNGKLKVSGVRKLGAGDFKLASQHISQILSTMGNTLVEMANKNKLSNSNSCIEKILNMSMEIGDVISSVAKGIQSMVNLQITDPTTNQVRQLNDSDFTLASNNVNKILTSISNAFYNTYQNNKSIYDDGTDSPALIIAKAIENITDVLGKASYLVARYATGTFRILNADGKTWKEVTVTSADISTASTNIENVLLALGNGINNVLSDKTGGSIYYTKSLLTTIQEGLISMVGVISTSAEWVARYASGEFNIYDKTNKQTKTIIVKPENIEQATINIEKVLLALGNGINNVNADKVTGKLFGPSGKTIIDNIKTGLEAMISVVAIAADPVARYASGDFIVLDPVTNKYVEKHIDTSLIPQATTNIENILLALGNGINTAYQRNTKIWESSYNGDGVAGFFTGSKSSIMDNIANGLDAAISIIKKAAGIIVNVTEQNYDTKSFKTKVSSILTAIVDTLNPTNESNTQLKDFLKKFKDESDDLMDGFDIIESTVKNVVNHINASIKSINSISKNFKESFTTILGPTLDPYKYSTESIVDLINNVKIKMATLSNNPSKDTTPADGVFSAISKRLTAAVSTDAISDELKNVNKQLSIVTDIYNTVKPIAKEMTITFTQVQTSMVSLKGIIDKISVLEFEKSKTSVIEAIADAFEQIMWMASYGSTVKPASFTSISASITSLTNIIKEISEMQAPNTTVLDALQPMINKIIGLVASASKQGLSEGDVNTFKILMSATNLLVEIASKSSGLRENSGKVFESLATGINKINKVLAQTPKKAIDNFKFEVQEVQKFVKAINTIKLQNLKYLNQFMDAANKFAKASGGMDKLALAISTKLSVQLERLSKELAESKKTMELAEQIQENRHNLINESVEQIRTLLDAELNIRVIPEGTDTATPTATGDTGTQGGSQKSKPVQTTPVPKGKE